MPNGLLALRIMLYELFRDPVDLSLNMYHCKKEKSTDKYAKHDLCTWMWEKKNVIK